MRGIYKTMLFVFLLAFFALPFDSVHAIGLTKAPSNLGLVGYWPLSEGAGTSTGDMSGNSNTGTMNTFASPATSTSGWIKGKLGNALAFDGASDYIDLGNGASLEPATAMTISAWVKPTTCTPSGHFLSKDTRYYLRLQGTGAGCILRFQVTTGVGVVTIDSAQGVLTTGVWQHVVGTWDGANMRSYRDGVLVAGPTAQTGTLTTTATTAQIGISTGSILPFNGSVDEVRLYNRALSQAEISALVKTGKTVLKQSNNRGLVAYWPFSEGSGTVLGDASGNGNSGTMTNFSSPATSTSGWGKGKLGNALNFNGSNNAIAIPDSASLNLMSTSTTTAAAWVYLTAYPDATSQWIHQVLGDEDASCGSFIFRIGSQGSATYNKRIGINFRTPTDHDTQNNTDLPLNTWTHIAVTTDGSNARFYINGLLDTTNVYTFTPQSTSCQWSIGYNPGRYFQGAIDEVRLYNRTLSPAEIFNLFKAGVTKVKAPDNRGLLGYWSFNEGAGTSAGDFSGNSRSMTLTNMASPATSVSGWTSGKFGKAVAFDGTNDHVLGTDNSSIAGSTALSVSSWMYMASTPSGVTSIIRKDGEFTPYQVRNAGPDCPLTQICFIVWVPGLNDSGVNLTNLPTGRWFHMVTTWTSGAAPILYIDGRFAANYDISITGTVTDSANPLVFGATEAGAEPFTGKIDEVRIYNRALTAAEVSSLYNYGR